MELGNGKFWKNFEVYARKVKIAKKGFILKVILVELQKGKRELERRLLENK